MFTAKDVVKAYAVTGLKPIYGSFMSHDFTCACALTALYMTKKVDTMTLEEAWKELKKSENIGFSDNIVQTIGIEVEVGNANDFVTDFYSGYDAKVEREFMMQNNKFYKLGREIRKEVESLLGVELKRD